jgi:hypothetical protein
MVVYGAPDLVLKYARPMSMETAKAQWSLGGGRYNADFRSGTWLADAMRFGRDSVALGQAFKAKEKALYENSQQVLGGLVVPYEVADDVVATVQRRLFGCIPFPSRLTRFPWAVVQERVSGDDMLGVRLKKAAHEESLPDILALLDALIETRELSLIRGAYTTDPQPENYAVADDGKVLLHDIGSVTFDRKQATLALKSDDESVRERINTSRDTLIAMYTSCLEPMAEHPDVQKILRKFSTTFAAFYEPRTVARMGKVLRRNNPVPNVRIPG